MANHADAKDVGRSTTGMRNARLEKNAGIRGDASIATRNILEKVDAKEDTHATTPARANTVARSTTATAGAKEDISATGYGDAAAAEENTTGRGGAVVEQNVADNQQKLRHPSPLKKCGAKARG